MYRNTLNAKNSNPKVLNYNSLKKLKPLQKDGYKFLGWYKNDKKIYSIKGKAKKVYVFAKWKKINTFYVIYHYDKRKIIKKKYYNNKRQILTVPNKTGCIFNGWYISKKTNKRIKSIKAGNLKSFNVYAKWGKKYIELNMI